MILTITLNPCIDKSSAVEQLQPEAKLRCTEVVNEPGGGGINISKALKKLGTASIALFPAGGNNGNMLCALLKEEGISFHRVETQTETRENWIVQETATNHQYRFTFPGRAVQEETISKLIDEIQSFSPVYIVASGSLPPGLPAHFYALIVEMATANGAKCIVDTSGPALEALKGKQAYLVKPNIGELSKLLNIENIEKAEVPDAAHQVVKEGYAEIVVVSMGPSGAWLVTATERYFAAAPLVEKKSTVGAGDSMVAGIIHSIQKGMSLEQALRFGVACGTAATMNEGTQLFKKADVEKLYAKINE